MSCIYHYANQDSSGVVFVIGLECFVKENRIWIRGIPRHWRQFYWVSKSQDWIEDATTDFIFSIVFVKLRINITQTDYWRLLLTVQFIHIHIPIKVNASVSPIEENKSNLFSHRSDS
uniref:Uncharacterized protein n=1 Tax=Trichobilharzia regenti TaxID=157069 RepID=A0AA85IZP3_TRIRE|nr:unnamed protein product [Trichobilharzia regenti]